VGISLIASASNGVLIIGHSAEMHYYGIKMTYKIIALAIFTVLSAHVFIPQYRLMKLTSVYEVRSSRAFSNLINYRKLLQIEGGEDRSGCTLFLPSES